jgi:hypothetical protein
VAARLVVDAGVVAADAAGVDDDDAAAATEEEEEEDEEDDAAAAAAAEADDAAAAADGGCFRVRIPTASMCFMTLSASLRLPVMAVTAVRNSLLV